MLSRAVKTYPEIEFSKCVVPDDLKNMGGFDLIFSNACLHWISNHETLLPKLVAKLNDGGVLAVQMPLVQYADFYRILNRLVASEKWNKLSGVSNFHNLLPNETYDILAKAASDVEMWDTTYYHVVPDHKAVIEWYKGSGLRPYLDVLSTEEQRVFLADLLAEIEANYPVMSDGKVILKMPRLFFIAHK